MRTNPFSDIYAQSNIGNSREKFENLPSFPRMIDIELTNTCNFRCLMCPTGNFSMQRKSGFMDEELFYKILDEVKDRKTGLRFIRWGEPTTHPKMIEFIRAASKAGCLTHINTNGSKLDQAYIENLIDDGLSSIKFSFQGIDRKSFNEMRNTDFFIELVEVIRLFHTIRGDRDLPFIQVSTSITYETEEQVGHFRLLMEPIVDQVSVGHTTFDHLDLATVRLRPSELEMLELLKRQESVEKVHPECPEVYDKLSVNYDGTITACCWDSDELMVIGDLKESSLSDIWHSEKLNEYREILAEMRHDDLELCSTCYKYWE